MKKAVLLSIQPFWCALIARGEKTFEIRKNAPTLETPFKCYIYCTKAKNSAYRLTPCNNLKLEFNGKILGEFLCDGIQPLPFGKSYTETEYCPLLAIHSKLTKKEVYEYGQGKTLYAWHISGLKVYEEPKDISEVGLERAPQSWGYCEDMGLLWGKYGEDAVRIWSA